MKHLLFFLLTISMGGATSLWAQEKHFIFIQNENSQAFYVTLAGKNYSSTASGYVIIPKLSEGNYSIAIGFALNEHPEQNFQISVGTKDLGYSLRNMGDKSWVLYNLQTLASIQGKPSPASGTTKQNGDKLNSDQPITFSPKKAEQTTKSDSGNEINKNITGQNKTQVGVEPETKPAAATKKEVQIVGDNELNNPGGNKVDKAENQIEKVDAVVTRKNEKKEEIQQAKPNEAKTKRDFSMGSIKKIEEVKGKEGILLTYVDAQYRKADTIQLVIPASTTPSVDGVGKQENAGYAISQAPELKKNSGDTKFLPIAIEPLKGEQPNEDLLKNSEAKVNSQCQEMATEDDYTRVRRKMAHENTDEKMIAEARKFYRNKCFTASQLKALSTLFLSDEGRLKFFDASYEYVYDPTKFADLESEFIDPSFADRFRALLKN